MSSLRDIIKRAIDLSKYRQKLMSILFEQDPGIIGYFFDDYANKQDVARNIKYLQNKYELIEDTLGGLLEHGYGIYDNKEAEKIMHELADEAITNFIKKQEKVIDNVPNLKRTISSSLTEQEFIDYLRKPDTKLGKHWSISMPHAVEPNPNDKYEYTFVIDTPSIQDINLDNTMEVRLILETIEDEITLKPNAEVKLIGLLDEHGQNIELPSDVKNKTFRI